MAKNWESFVEEYAKEQYEKAIFNLTKMVAKWIDSPIERVMYVCLRDDFQSSVAAGLAELDAQKKIGKYTVDFYLSYQTESGLAEFIIECDGHDYHERTKEQAAHDKKRDRYFTENGYIVLRYTGSEILRDRRSLTGSIWSIIVQKDGVVGCG